jgi:hypothetical protein
VISPSLPGVIEILKEIYHFDGRFDALRPPTQAEVSNETMLVNRDLNGDVCRCG